jgi:nucleotide-binding universal stress UspA family protein
MSYKSILVHLDTSEAAAQRLEVAMHVARQFDAHLHALLSVAKPEAGSIFLAAGSAAYLAERGQLSAERSEALEKRCRAQGAHAGRAGLAVQFSQGGADGGASVLEAARLADLVIAGQPNAEDPEAFVAGQFLEHLVLDAGRPVLVVPFAGSFDTVGARVLVAWDASREATRALADAAPFIERAERTTIVTIEALGGALPPVRLPGAEIASVVARHGNHIDIDDIETTTGSSVADVLLSRACDMGADLIVMGCYGHARWRELVVGGATRAMLESMTVPVLMSH